MKTALISVRVSGRRQVEGTSPATQEADCRAWCKREGATVPKDGVYRDDAESAKTMDRPGLLSALERVRKGGIDYLVVWKMDRWARNTTEGLVVRAELQRHGCRLISATEPITDDATGEFLTTILLGAAKLDNDVRSARAKRAMRAVAQAGGWPHRAPAGYRQEILGREARGGKLPILVPVEPQASALRKAFEGVAAGAMSMADVIRALASVGIKSHSVQLAFRQPIYGGVIQGPLTDGKAIPTAFPGLVPRGTWLAARARLRAYVRRIKPENGEWLLAGVATCEKCGTRIRGAMSVGRTGKRYAYYDCRHGHVRIKAEDAHRDLQRILSEQWLPTIGNIREIVVRQVAEMTEEGRAARTEAEKARDVAERRLDKVFRGWSDGVIDDDTYRKKSAEMRAEVDALTIEVSAHQEAAEDLLNSMDRIVEAVSDPLTTWRTLPIQGRRSMAEILGGGFDITLRGECRTKKHPKNAGKSGCFDKLKMARLPSEIVEPIRRLALIVQNLQESSLAAADFGRVAAASAS